MSHPQQRETEDSFERIVTRTALFVAALVALSIPICFAFIQYNDLSTSLTFKAKVKSSSVSELIAQIPETWMFAENRIQGIISRVPVALENEYVQVVDKSGEIVTAAGVPPTGQIMKVSFPLSDSGAVVGNLIVTTSLNGLIFSIVSSVLFSLALASLMFLVMKTLPLRALRRASDALFKEKERAETTLHAIGDAVITTDTNSVVNYINPAAQHMLGYSLNEVQGKKISDVVQLFKTETDKKIDSSLTEALNRHANVSSNGENHLVRKDGFKVDVEESAAPMHARDGTVSGGVVVLRDVSLVRNYLRQRSWEASHDLLTGLLNRHEFERRVQHALAKTKRGVGQYVLCYMDLDRFKLVNDTSGHAAGDELLVQISKLILEHIRVTDNLARLGSDEFGVLLENCDIDYGQKIATDIKAAIDSYNFSWQSRQHAIGVSIGMTLITENHANATEIIAEADNACYWSKEQGLDRVVVSIPSDPDLMARRNEVGWVPRINSAFKENRLVLYHQPYKTLNTSRDHNAHIEILLRMLDEVGEIVLPDRFLPAAERYAMMPEIDRWVINQVFNQYDSLLAQRDGRPTTFCINLSGASINSSGFLDFIREQSQKYKFQQGDICFELTETVAVNNLQTAKAFINECKAMGFSFALDDFGAGMSSFGYLKTLPVDYLKIDGSFVKDIEHDSIDRAMVQTINHIGHLLGKLTIAEFAKNERIVEELEAIGVDFAQGYGVCAPSPLFA